MSAHTQASVLAEFEEVSLEPNESFPHGIKKFNRYACAQALAEARNALVLDDAKVRGAEDAYDDCVAAYNEQHPDREHVDACRPDAMRAALLAAGFTEREA